MDALVESVGPRWLTMVQVAELAGWSAGTVGDAARRGEIVQRHLGRRHPSLDLASAVAWAAARRVRIAQEALVRAERRDRRARVGEQPDDEHVWLDYAAAAELLEVTGRYVNMLAREDRLPFTVAGGRRWYREDHLQMMVAARSLERQHLER